MDALCAQTVGMWCSRAVQPRETIRRMFTECGQAMSFLSEIAAVQVPEPRTGIRAGFFLVLLFAAMVAGGAPVFAQQRKGLPSLSAPLTAQDAREGVAQGEMRPLGDVLRQLREKVGGRQLDAQLVSASPNPVYEIQWLTADGRRIDFVVDAQTGAILRQRGG